MKYQVGDKVKVIHDGCIRHLEVGMICTVSKVNEDGHITGIKEVEDKSPGRYGYSNDWYEPVETKYEFKEGDIVEQIYPCSGVKVGTRGTLKYNYGSSGNLYHGCCSCQSNWRLISKKEDVKQKTSHLFQAGQVVKINKGGSRDSFPGGPGWNTGMDEFIGKIATIVSRLTTNGGVNAYRIDIDNTYWTWDERWLEPAQLDDLPININVTSGAAGGSMPICGSAYNCTGYGVTLNSESVGPILQQAKEKLIEQNKPKTIMSKLTNSFKLLTDKPTQTLRKAGYIDGDLELTSTGLEALTSILLSVHKEELVKLAEEKLEEEKANK